MLSDLLKPEIRKFIADHQNDDEQLLILKQKDVLGVPVTSIAQQIAGRRKAKDKLPTFYNNPAVIYPPGINLEQSSSEKTARFKSDLISKQLFSLSGTAPNHPAQGVDLTGGLGVDSFFLSKHFLQFDFIEPHHPLLEIARHNHSQLGATNITYHNTNAESFLMDLTRKVDFIFIDPSRRTEHKKVFTLHDSEPDIISLQSKIFERTHLVLVKASPLLDISLALKELKFVKTVCVVSVNNEVKELLFLCEQNFVQEPFIEAVNLHGESIPELFRFRISEEAAIAVEYDNPGAFLYEPNASLMKAGAFKSISKYFELKKIHPNTHLYTSEKRMDAFPGRIFKTVAAVKPDPKIVKQFFPDQKANVITRNYPLSVEELKKKTALKDGGDDYLLGFSGPKEKFLMVCQRLK